MSSEFRPAQFLDEIGFSLLQKRISGVRTVFLLKLEDAVNPEQCERKSGLPVDELEDFRMKIEPCRQSCVNLRRNEGRNKQSFNPVIRILYPSENLDVVYDFVDRA